MLLPGFTPKVISRLRHPKDSPMTNLIPLLERFGLVSAKSDSTDPFDLRLMRLGTREARARSLCPLFRNQPPHSADAKTS